MQRYDEYKDSGIEWIGDIPKDWEVKRSKYIFNLIQTGTTPPTKNTKYFNGEINWFNPVDLNHNILTESTKKLSSLAIEDNQVKLFYQDSILIVAIGATAGKTAYLSIDATFNQQITGFKSKNENNYYLYFLLKNFSTIFLKLANFTTLPILNNEFFKSFFLPIPSLDEQIAIANYLNKKTAEIDKLITQKEKLLELYEEEKSAIINQAVTKGLDPDVKMKECRIAWIGEIPEHWELKRIGYSFKTIGSGTTPKTSETSYYDGDFHWLNTGDLNNGYIYDTSKKITQKAIEDISTLRVYPKNSLVIAMYGATIGKVGITKIPTTVNQACCVLNNSDLFRNKFLFYWLILNKPHIIKMAEGGGQPNISQEIVRNLKVQAPPLEEQDILIEYIETKHSLIDQKIQKTKQIIALQKEYSTALISEVVTGKIKVSEEG